MFCFKPNNIEQPLTFKPTFVWARIGQKTFALTERKQDILDLRSPSTIWVLLSKCRYAKFVQLRNDVLFNWIEMASQIVTVDA